MTWLSTFRPCRSSLLIYHSHFSRSTHLLSCCRSADNKPALPYSMRNKEISGGYPGRRCRRVAVRRHAITSFLLPCVQHTLNLQPPAQNLSHSSLKTIASLSATGRTPSPNTLPPRGCAASLCNYTLFSSIFNVPPGSPRIPAGGQSCPQYVLITTPIDLPRAY